MWLYDHFYLVMWQVERILQNVRSISNPLEKYVAVMDLQVLPVLNRIVHTLCSFPHILYPILKS